MKLTPGITHACEGLDGISWNILGQTYVPKSVSEDSFSWHATFPPGTFVPPHIHPTQDEFIYMLEGQLELVLDDRIDLATQVEAGVREPGRGEQLYPVAPQPRGIGTVHGNDRLLRSSVPAASSCQKPGGSLS